MDWHTLLLEHWPIKFAAAVMLLAYVIDAKVLKVPNWLTYPFIAAGFAFHLFAPSGHGLVFALAGFAMGLASLMPLYVIGGMGAGDVKLMTGTGTWVGFWLMLDASLAGILVGGVMGLVMIVVSGRWRHHLGMCGVILKDIWTLRDPWKIAGKASERKPTMLLLPYGVPVCIGAIGAFQMHGVLF